MSEKKLDIARKLSTSYHYIEDLLIFNSDNHGRTQDEDVPTRISFE